MKLQYTGQENIPAHADAVWRFVNDPEKVGYCLPEVVEVKRPRSEAFRRRRPLDAQAQKLIAQTFANVREKLSTSARARRISIPDCVVRAFDPHV